MKCRAYLLAGALSMALCGVQAQTNLLVITESDESPTPTVTYNGNPVTLDSSSTLFKDNWTIVLPNGFNLLPLGEVFLGEPENALEVNDILIGTQPTTLVWASDVAAPAGAGAFPNPLLITTAGFYVGPFDTEYFGLKLVDEENRTSVPDAGSTVTLLGMSLFGLFISSRRKVA